MAAARRRRGRQRPDSLSPWLVLLLCLLGAAVVVTALVFLLPAAEDPSVAGTESADGNCPRTPVRLAAAPEIAAALSGALAEQGCSTLDFTDLTAAGPAPEADPVVPVIASTPIVITGLEQAPKDWRQALTESGVAAGDPADDAAAAAALAAAIRGLDADQVAQLVLAMARTGRDDSDRPQVRTEQAAISAGLDPVAPRAGTVHLDFGIHHLGGDLPDDLPALLTSAPLTDALLAAGFRVGERAPAAGLGPVESTAVTAEQATHAVATWSALAVPSRMLAVIDVSGSMAQPVHRTGQQPDSQPGQQTGQQPGATTRMELTIAAARTGLDLFGDDAAIGLWSFSHRVGNNGGDHVELVGPRPLGLDDQRERLRAALDALPARVGGATTLYRTALAAYRAATEDYDPDAVNSVLLFTDGSNDDPFSIGLDELVAELAELADPQRPVRIIAVGIGAEADMDALGRISDATGGTALVAQRPEDIAVVFQQALIAGTD